MSNDNYFQKKSLMNNNIQFPSLNNTLKSLNGNSTFHLGKKSCDEKDKNKLNKNISLNNNIRYETLNSYNNKAKSNRQNHSLNNDKQKNINIKSINNSISINIPNKNKKIYHSKKIDKIPNKLIFSNPNLR